MGQGGGDTKEKNFAVQVSKYVNCDFEPSRVDPLVKFTQTATGLSD